MNMLIYKNFPFKQMVVKVISVMCSSDTLEIPETLKLIQLNLRKNQNSQIHSYRDYGLRYSSSTSKMHNYKLKLIHKRVR